MVKSHHTKLALRGHQKSDEPKQIYSKKNHRPDSRINTDTENVSKLHGDGLRDDLIQEFKTVSTPVY